VDTGDDDRPRRHRLKPHRYHTEANLCQARAPLITINDASPLSSPDASGTPTFYTKKTHKKIKETERKRVLIGFLIFFVGRCSG
jgi:hypothetical protein